MEAEKIVICWSGGKDSTMAIHELRGAGRYDIVAAITTVSEAYDRICIHGVRRALLHRQTEVLGLPLHEVWLSKESTNAEYESKMDAALLVYKARGIRKVAFGDLFLEDLKAYRDKNLARIGMEGLYLEGLYPIWKRDTRELAKTVIALGYKAVLTCVDTQALDASFVGRAFDASLLADLPPKVDPCGENGEFHTFVWDGPLFKEPVKIQLGETVVRGRFAYRDLVELPTQQPARA
jgi:uncharacterized protein (TIGR00290 family)